MNLFDPDGIFTFDFGGARKVCCCDRLRIDGLVKVIGWVPLARVTALHGHVATVRYETSTLRERSYACADLAPVCPLEELAKIASEV